MTVNEREIRIEGVTGGRGGDDVFIEADLLNPVTGEPEFQVEATGVVGGTELYRHLYLEAPTAVSEEQVVELIETCLSYYENNNPELVQKIAGKIEDGLLLSGAGISYLGSDHFKTLRFWISESARLEHEIFLYQRPLNWEQIERHLREEHTDFDLLSDIGFFCYHLKRRSMTVETHPDLPIDGMATFFSNLTQGKVGSADVEKVVAEAKKLYSIHGGYLC